MSAGKSNPKSLVEAVQAVFDALEPFDESARQRIIQSATSLFGIAVGQASATSAPARQFGTGNSPAQRTSERPLSPVELIQDKQPATNPQKITLFAYYREKVEGMSRFAKDDLRPYFAKAKLPPPQNFDRDFHTAVSQGWIYEDGADSYLTSKGLEAVEAGFGGRGQPRGAPVAKAKAIAKRKRRTR